MQTALFCSNNADLVQMQKTLRLISVTHCLHKGIPGLKLEMDSSKQYDGQLHYYRKNSKNLGHLKQLP